MICTCCKKTQTEAQLIGELCKTCRDKGLCKHGRYDYICKDCDSKGIVERNRRRQRLINTSVRTFFMNMPK